MKYLLIMFCSLCCLYGCLDAEVAPRPSPMDQGMEENFDARPPLVAPHTGSGYGSGYSGSAPPELSYDQYIESDLGDEETLDAGVESPDAD